MNKALPPSHEMMIVVNRANRAFSELLRTCLSHHDLTIPQWGLMGQLSSQSNMRPTNIAKLLGVKPPFIAKIIATLELAGIVESVPFPDDERGKMVGLTEHGRSVVAHVEPMLQHCLHEQFGDVSEQEISNYFSLNSYIAHNVSHH